MKMKMLLSASVAVLTMFFMTSCGGGQGSGTGQVSTSTGWEYNSMDNGGFEVVDYVEQETGPGLVLVEGGAFQMGRVEQELMFNWDNQPRKVTLPSFYMDETEIKNVDYREYLNWARRVFC